MPKISHPPAKVSCYNCEKIFFRDFGRFDEAIKFHWKQYCSGKCQSEAKNFQVSLDCSRPGCKETFYRTPSDLRKSKDVYCSLHCAAVVNNKKYPKRSAVKKNCLNCGKAFTGKKFFCSITCKFKGQIKPSNKIVGLIQDFYIQNNRIPSKREISYCRAARARFGSWNNAIKAASFDPNPVMFANRHIARDGHECDSFTEKIIDDWMFEKGIKHKRDVPYPGNKGFTCDFVVGKKWIEFFGLAGQLKKYDLLKRRKLNLVKRHEINLVKLFPNDIFPKNKLGLILK